MTQIKGQFTKRIHLIGIGGAGMSPLAEVLHSRGHTITGSDRVRSAASLRLEKLGIVIQYDHIPRLVERAEMVVYSSAVREGNPERVYAKEKGIRTIRRAEVLGDLMRGQYTICIAGTHGKTTTTSLTGAIFQEAGVNPTILVGGMLKSNDSHAVIGSGPVLIAEADEYDRSFLAMYPSLAILTNVEADHLDCYGTLEAVYDAFVAFTERLPFYGAVVVCADDPGIKRILPRISARVITYGLDNADYTAENIDFEAGMPMFTVRQRGTVLARVQLSIPGEHNVLNSLAAIAAACEMGISFPLIQKGLVSFKGVQRRFEILSRENNIVIVDDYAHHPNEIRATLKAARKCAFRRVVAVFQPHLYSRTRDFMSEFADALGGADVVYLTDIYKAREEPIPGVSSQGILDIILQNGHGSAFLVSDQNVLCEKIRDNCTEGDGIIFMGAGNIWECAIRLKEMVCNG